MLFPLRHDRRLRSTPWLTGALIALNVVCFALTYGAMRDMAFAPPDADQAFLFAHFPPLRYCLWPVGEGFQGWQLFTSAFLHADLMHLLGNMLFLWIFGGAVEDRFGKIGFLAFYAAGAAASGGAHLALGAHGFMLGASGAISALTGAFLVLFPRVRIHVVYWFFFIGTFELSAGWVLLFYFAKDALFFASSGAGVAYDAHLGGFLLGFLVAAGLLATKILAREPEWDLLALINHWRRRQQFKQVANENPVWHKDSAQNLRPKTNAPALPPFVQAQRENIFYFAARQQMQEAAAAYGALLADHPDQVLPETLQHDLGTLLMKNGDHAQAAQALRLLLKHFPQRADRAQTQLLLAVLCLRYLDQADEAQVLLAEALPRLEGAQKRMAEGLLGAI